MNKALFNLPVLTAATFCLAATAVIVAMVFTPASPGPTLLLDEPWDAPAFEVMDHNGNTLTRENMLGKVWVCDFFLTRCNGVCPILGLKMAATAKQLASDSAMSDVKLVSFSVDPEHDTVDIIQAYREKNMPFWDNGSETQRADLEQRWVHTRANEQAAFWQTIRQGFRLHVGPASPDDPSTPIAHSRRFILVDQQGAIRGLYDAYSAEELETMMYDIRRVVVELN